MQTQNMDSLVQGIQAIIKNRNSLLDEDVKLLNDVLKLLKELKQKTRQKDISAALTLVQIIETLTKVFFMINHYQNWHR